MVKVSICVGSACHMKGAYATTQMFQEALEKAKKTFTEYPVRDCVTLERVRVWETSSSWAEYGE